LRSHPRRLGLQAPPLDPDAVVTIDESRSPRTIKTTLTSASAGDDSHVRTADDGAVMFDSLSTDVSRLAKLMMFYDAIGGSAYASVPNRYQSFIDLSRLLKGDQAILLARAPADAGSQWINSSIANEPGGASAPPADAASPGPATLSRLPRPPLDLLPLHHPALAIQETDAPRRAAQSLRSLARADAMTSTTQRAAALRAFATNHGGPPRRG